MNTTSEALWLVFAMGAVILLCRAFPFLFFFRSGGKTDASSRRGVILEFVEKTVPPAAMTVLAFNALGGAFLENLGNGIFALTASVFTVLIHLWKRNPLISIFGGTALYMVLTRIFGV